MSAEWFRAGIALVGGLGAALAWTYTQFATDEQLESAVTAQVERHEQLEGDFLLHVAQARTGTITQLMRDIRESPEGRARQTLCDALRQELAMLCQEAPNHAFCVDRNEILEDLSCR